jgi:hypothetical protein
MPIGFLAASAAWAADWEVRVTPGASFEVLHRQVPVVRAAYGFWGANWKYAAASLHLEGSLAKGYTFTGEVKNLGVKISGKTSRQDSRSLRFAYELDAESCSGSFVSRKEELECRPYAVAAEAIGWNRLVFAMGTP